MDSDNELVVVSSDDENSIDSTRNYDDDSDEYGDDDTSYYSDDILDEIEECNENYVDSEKESGKYYIGLCTKYRYRILMDIVISPENFVFFKTENVLQYLIINRGLSHCGYLSRTNKYIHIMKLYIDENGFYTAVLKTHWLRLVQRTWKRVFRERQAILKKRMNIINLRVKEITGKHKIGLNVLPNIHGMLFVKRHQI